MRCGHKSAAFKLLGWAMMKPTPGAFIFWHIVNFPSGVEKKAAIESFTKVFDVWQGAMDKVPPVGRVIQYESTAIYDKAHIKLVFVQPHASSEGFICSDGQFRTFKIPEQLDGSGGVLAYVTEGSDIIFFDKGENWVAMDVDDKRKISLFDVANHEVGHSHGLAHSNVPSSIMSTYYEGISKPFSYDDQMGLNASWSKIKKSIK